jgi:hypothetical protein
MREGKDARKIERGRSRKEKERQRVIYDKHERTSDTAAAPSAEGYSLDTSP